MALKASIHILPLLAATLLCGLLLLVALKTANVATEPIGSPPNNYGPNAIAALQTTQPALQNRMAIDIVSEKHDDPKLEAAAEVVENRLQQSGLFQSVGIRSVEQGISGLSDHFIRHLPYLLNSRQLQQLVAPRLDEQQIRQSLIAAKARFAETAGGLSKPVTIKDPLGFRQIALSQLASLNALSGMTVTNGRFASADRRRRLIPATLADTTIDANMANAVRRLLHDLNKTVGQQFGSGISLTLAGPFRYAVNQRNMVIGDIKQVAMWASVVMCVLLLIFFSPAYLGLLALLPAVTGTSLALCLLSWIYGSISIMVLGFAVTITAITMTPGMTCLIFFASPTNDKSQAAVREFRSVTLPTMLTSMLGFGVLGFSGITVFEQLGWLTAIGLGLAFIFTQFVFPRMLPGPWPTATRSRKPIFRFVNRLMSAGRFHLVLALLAAGTLSAFIRPQIDIDLRTTTDISQQAPNWPMSLADRQADGFNTICLVTEAASLTSLLAKCDRLQEYLDTETHAGSIQKTATPSLFFPGPNRRMNNLNAWRQFWSDARIRSVSRTIQREGVPLGVAHSANDAFLKMLAADTPDEMAIPSTAMPLMGISVNPSGDRWRLVTRITPRAQFDKQRFLRRMHDISSVYDPTTYFRHKGRQLFVKSIGTMVITALGLILLMLLFTADVQIAVIGLVPLVFAGVCTLGTLGLMDRAPGLPVLMFAATVLGVSAGLPLFIIRGYQRYQRLDHPDLGITYMAGCLFAGASLVGFGVLMDASHSLFKDTGIVTFLGIGYAFIGSLLILPPLLKKRFDTVPADTGGVAWRYRNMTPLPRMAARYKLHVDPLLGELETLVPQKTDMANLLEVGCGFGIIACWLADKYPTATIHGIEANAEKLRFAALALGDRGRITQGQAPHLPSMDVLLDLVIMLDVSHCLEDWELKKTLERIHERLLPGGLLIMRSIMKPPASRHWLWHRTHLLSRKKGARNCYRGQASLLSMLAKCGFETVTMRTSGKRAERYWHVARPH